MLSMFSNMDSTNYFALVVSIIVVFLLAKYLWEMFMWKSTSSIRVSGPMPVSEFNAGTSNEPYHLLLKWLATNVGKFQHSKIEFKINGPEDETKFVKLPTFGTHSFTYKGKRVNLLREKNPETKVDGIPYESMIMKTWLEDSPILDDIMDEAQRYSSGPIVEDSDKTVFYSASNYQWFQIGKPKRRLFLSSVILAACLKDKLLADVREFLESEDWYAERGIPYRRGYLLYGPGGCGKTSLVKAIAGELGYSICVLPLGSNLSDDELLELMNTTPENSIILLEDIDVAFKFREFNGGKTPSSSVDILRVDGRNNSSLSFHGFLNAIDGAASPEGKIVFMTANHVKFLDQGLLRPGRVDFNMMIGLPVGSQIQAMFNRFYPGSTPDLAKRFTGIVCGIKGTITMAMLQGLFLLNKNNPEDALNNLQRYFKERQFEVWKPDIFKMRMSTSDGLLKSKGN